MKIHELKTWPQFYEVVANGTKNFEMRLNDREFRIGDMLRLCEFDPEVNTYSGRSCDRRIKYILSWRDFPKIPENWVLMAIFGI
jgi:hypothetical protein